MIKEIIESKQDMCVEEEIIDDWEWWLSEFQEVVIGLVETDEGRGTRDEEEEEERVWNVYLHYLAKIGTVPWQGGWKGRGRGESVLICMNVIYVHLRLAKK